QVNGHDLVVIASHWTSRLGGKAKSDPHRDDYGDRIYGVFKAMFQANPKVDFLVCGDFNDTPQDTSVTEHLRATGDMQAVLRSREGDPRLLHLLAGKDPNEHGTHFYSPHWYIFDHIAVSPGLLDKAGWSCDPASASVVNSLFRPGDKKRHPWRFGSPH